MKANLDDSQLQSLRAVFGARVPADPGQAVRMLEASALDPAARASLREQVMALAGQRLDGLKAASEALGDGRGDARTQRAIPSGLALQMAQLSGKAPVSGIEVKQGGLTEAQAQALLAMGVAQDDLPKAAAGEVVIALLPTVHGDDTIASVQVAADHVKAAIISIHVEGHGLQAMGHFREQAYRVARAFGHAQLELGGAAVINGKIEVMLKRQGFELGERPVPEGLGNDGMMEIYAKMIPVPEARA